jgi:hypothetical protein
MYVSIAAASTRVSCIHLSQRTLATDAAGATRKRLQTLEGILLHFCLRAAAAVMEVQKTDEEKNWQVYIDSPLFARGLEESPCKFPLVCLSHFANTYFFLRILQLPIVRRRGSSS